MSFFAELKRRNVLRAGAFYAASAWLLVQVATQVFPFFAVPNWAVRWIVVAAIVGFPFAMLFSWFYEWTPQGLQRESELSPNESGSRHSGKRLDLWIIAILSLAVVLLLTNQFVRHGDENQAAGVPSATAIPAASIAVLPLINESGDPGEQYFSDGLSEGMISALSQFGGLRVISRNSSFQFRESKDDAKTIGARLGVAHLLEGSVRHVGDTVRINATLINAAMDTMLWSQHYDRPYKDLFALQDEIANSVAEALKAQLLPNAGAVVQSDHPPGGNVDAYNAYLQGAFYDNRGTAADYRKAIEFYHSAIELDPRYAMAYSRLALEWLNLARKFLSGLEAQEAYRHARAAIDTALALAPDLSAAHRSRGILLESADFDWKGAEAEYRRSLELAPNDISAKTALSRLLATLGDPGQAVDLLRQQLTSDPLCASCYNWLSSYLSPLGRLDEAEQAIRKAIDLQPGHADFYTQLTIIAIQRGDARAALSAAQKEIAAGGWQDIALAMAQQISGDSAAADAALKTLVETQPNDAGYQIAEVYALRNDPDKVFEWLDRAWANRDAGVDQLLYDPFILRYRRDPRFTAFCRKIQLPEPTL